MTYYADRPEELDRMEEVITHAEEWLIDIRQALERQDIAVFHCRAHGVSPMNQPLGSRDLYIPIEQLAGMSWQEQMHCAVVAFSN